MEKLDYLIDYLIKDGNIDKSQIPNNIEKQKLYRSLCNIREPKQISQEYIKAENEYLQEELKNKKITDINDIKMLEEIFQDLNITNRNKISIWKGDITTLKIDAIVNAANSKGLGCFVPCHSCIDNAIHTFAGLQLRLECNEIMKEKEYELKTSDVIITKAYNLPSKYVIHTVGPIIYTNVTKIEEKELSDCYINCLDLAVINNIKSIAFPCISTGEFRFPKTLAAKIAINTVDEFLNNSENKIEKVVFNVFSKEDLEIYEQEFKQFK